MLCWGDQTGEQGHREAGESPPLNLVAFSVPATNATVTLTGAQEINIFTCLIFKFLPEE